MPDYVCWHSKPATGNRLGVALGSQIWWSFRRSWAFRHGFVIGRVWSSISGCAIVHGYANICGWAWKSDNCLIDVHHSKNLKKSVWDAVDLFRCGFISVGLRFRCGFVVVLIWFCGDLAVVSFRSLRFVGLSRWKGELPIFRCLSIVLAFPYTPPTNDFHSLFNYYTVLLFYYFNMRSIKKECFLI